MEDDAPVLPDEPFFSPIRLLRAFAWYCWYLELTDGKGHVKFKQIVLNYHRAWAGRNRY